jgi:hypothetical protein
VVLEVFIDESGYTGEHHLDAIQPVFVLLCLDGFTLLIAKRHVNHPATSTSIRQSEARSTIC